MVLATSCTRFSLLCAVMRRGSSRCMHMVAWGDRCSSCSLYLPCAACIPPTPPYKPFRVPALCASPHDFSPAPIRRALGFPCHAILGSPRCPSCVFFLWHVAVFTSVSSCYCGCAVQVSIRPRCAQGVSCCCQLVGPNLRACFRYRWCLSLGVICGRLHCYKCQPQRL